MNSFFPSAFIKKIPDMLLPPLCLNCNERIDQSSNLCSACWRNLDFITPPFCRRCGLTLTGEHGSSVCCGPCLTYPPIFKRAFAPLLYNEASSDLILSIKYARRFDVMVLFSRILYQGEGKDILKQADYIVPVPLHWQRLWGRGYNQATLLARALARASGVKLVLSLLTRTGKTKSQRSLNAYQRWCNLSGAFKVNTDADIRGKKIVLVDDVFTTGVTLSECCLVLKKAGAKDVFGLTLARVDLPRPNISFSRRMDGLV